MRAILPIALVCAVVTGSQPGSSQSPQQTEKSPTTVDFQKVATALTDQIAALRTNHTSLSQLKIVEDRRPEKTWVHFICRHGITGERPNPDWTPHAKVEKNLPVFANDGIELSLYIHVGPYGGARQERFVPRLKRLLLGSEKNTEEKSSNKRMHLTKNSCAIFCR